jgi:hypothetical protein
VKHLTTPDDIRKNVRPVSAHLDDERIWVFIDEAEQLNVKPRITDALFIDLLEWTESEDKSAFPEAYEILMNGGIYESSIHCGTVKKIFKGLRLTLEYYVYAKLVKHNDENVTRFGYMQKEDEYSSRPDLRIKLAAEKDALSVADGYMADCIDFLESNKENIPLFKKPGIAKNRLRISIIGN